MAFGSLKANIRKARPVKEKTSSNVPVVPENAPVPETHPGKTRLTILLLGRAPAVMREFLCSMNENINEFLHPLGFAFYTQDLQTVSDIIEQKKKLEQFFWNFSKSDWPYGEESKPEQTYVFNISPSGVQQNAIELEIRCLTPESVRQTNRLDADAVWLLCDGALALETDDPFLDFIQDALNVIPTQAAKNLPVCLILSQIEGVGHFTGRGELSKLPDDAEEKLNRLCRRYFSCDMPVAVLPAQVYGGMECVGLDERHMPRLHICQNGFYQSYVPDNCHIPVLRTLQSLCADNDKPVWTDAARSALMQGVRSHYGKKFGNPDWKPVLLNGEEETD